jgi:transcriptional regulator with XRE-family HTH domain
MPQARVVNDDAVRFGAIVNRLRMGRGWSLADFAAASGMNATYLGVLERGGNMPNLATVVQLARVFGMKGWELVRELEQAQAGAVAGGRDVQDDGSGDSPA